MSVGCCAVNCMNRSSKGSVVGFFQFPIGPRRKKIWIWAISQMDTSGWKWEPSVHDHICRVHFVSGRPSKDENAIDYVPTMFRDMKKRSNALTSNPPREERAAKMSQNSATQEEAEDAASVLMDLSQSNVTLVLKQGPLLTVEFRLVTQSGRNMCIFMMK